MRAIRDLALGVTVLSLVACDSRTVEEHGDGLGQTSAAAFLEDVESYVVTSEISGRDYSISVALPFGYTDSAESYPVLYALDANGQFGTVVETARMLRYGEQIPQLVIVGIGYPFGGRQIRAGPHRIIDFFPTLERGWIEQMRPTWPGPIPEYEEGGAPDFLHFLLEELIPEIESGYRVISGDRAIYGHSGGGWFGLYALLEGGGAFRRAILGSPSLWWDDGLIFDIEEEYAAEHSSLPARVFLSVGAEETNERDEPFGGITCFCMTRNFDRLVELWSNRSYEDLEWTPHVFESENHNSVVPPTISRGLRYIYGAI